LLDADVVPVPLIAGHGVIRVRRPDVDEDLLDAVRAAPDRVAHWQARISEMEEAAKP
jgi:O-succinylbenzoate synthase